MRKKRETVEDEVGRVHRVKAEVGKAEVPQDELGRNLNQLLLGTGLIINITNDT